MSPTPGPPLSPPSDFAPETELRFRLAGIVPPAERAPGTYANAQRLLATLHWLRQPRSVAAEPSNTFSLVGSK
jgi:hypothetical protein